MRVYVSFPSYPRRFSSSINSRGVNSESLSFLDSSTCCCNSTTVFYVSLLSLRLCRTQSLHIESLPKPLMENCSMGNSLPQHLQVFFPSLGVIISFSISFLVLLLFGLFPTIHFIHKVLCLYLRREVRDKVVNSCAVLTRLSRFPHAPTATMWRIVVLTFF